MLLKFLVSSRMGRFKEGEKADKTRTVRDRRRRSQAQIFGHTRKKRAQNMREDTARVKSAGTSEKNKTSDTFKNGNLQNTLNHWPVWVWCFEGVTNTGAVLKTIP